MQVTQSSFRKASKANKCDEKVNWNEEKKEISKGVKEVVENDSDDEIIVIDRIVRK